MDVPFKPMGRKDIVKLEHVLLISTLFRKDVLEKVKNAEDRLTWVDSLAIAAGALAREKAGMPVSEIAMELGRTEATIRNHLSGKTEAGKLVRETYEQLVRGELQPLDIESIFEAQKLQEKLDKVKEKIEEILKILEA